MTGAEREEFMIQLHVNGKEYQVDESADATLLWVLRDRLKLHGTKFGCGIGVCGSCTVHVDGKAMRACQLEIGKLAGKKIVTIEGLPEDHPVKKAWIQDGTPQCGYCQPGQIMQAAALLAEDPKPSDEKINETMDRVLCRCGTYPRIRKSIRTAVGLMPKQGQGA